MKKKLTIKGKLPKQRNPVAFALCTQGQFKGKVFRNRKKEVAKFDWRKEKDLGVKPRSFVLWGLIPVIFPSGFTIPDECDIVTL